MLKGISKSVKVSPGDSIVTSGFTDRFPYGILIGTVSEILLEKTSNSYTLKVKTAANFYNVQFVYIINNLLKQEPQELLKRVKKTNE